MTRAILPMTMLLTVLGVASCFRDHPMTDTAVRGDGRQLRLVLER